MSDRRAPGTPLDAAGGLAAALAAVPLFAGMPDEDLDDFATAFTPVEAGAGEVLWWQASPVDGLHVLLTGEARILRRLPGEREVEIARLGAGAVMGEIPLLGGGTRSATVRAASACTLAFLDRRDFHARVQLGRPGAMLLKRRIVESACARVRADHAMLAAALEGGAGPATSAPVPDPRAAATSAVPAPSLAYVSHLPFFRHLEADGVASLLDRGETLQFPPGTVLLEEGETADRCFITLNGAVEDVLCRGPRGIRVRFAGPGRAVCYLGMLDGEPASATSVARERTVALALGAEDVRARLDGDDDVSRAFTAALEHDLMDALRSTASPKSHLASAVPA